MSEEGRGISKADEIIDKIQSVRSENNKNWMQLLRIAFREAPEEAGEVMKKIEICDRLVSNLTKELVEVKE